MQAATKDLIRYKSEFYDLIVHHLETISGDTVVVEIGAHTGEWLSGLMSRFPVTRAFAIDIWPRRAMRSLSSMFPQWCSRLEPWIFSTAFPLRGRSQEWGQVWPKQFRPDVLYVDGSHKYHDVLEDCRVWWPLVKPGGFVFWHDTNEDDVQRALLDFVAEEGGVHKYLLLSKSLRWGPGNVETRFMRKPNELR